MKNIYEKLISAFRDKEYAHAYMDSFLVDRIASQIYTLRKNRGWSQAELSNKSGIAQERISVIESGDFSSLTMKTLKKLAYAFDVNLSIRFESFHDAIEDIVSLSETKLAVVEREESIKNPFVTVWNMKKNTLINFVTNNREIGTVSPTLITSVASNEEFAEAA